MIIWLFNHYAYTPEQSGITRHYDLAQSLIARGHQVRIFAAGFHHGRQVEMCEYAPGKNVQHTCVGDIQYSWIKVPAYQSSGWRRLLGMWLYRCRAYAAACELSSQETPDVIVGSSPHLWAAQAAAKVARRLKCGFGLEIRDIWPDTLIELGVARWHPLVLNWQRLAKRLYQQADAIVSPLPDFKRYLQDQGYDRAVMWLPNGISVQPAQVFTAPKSNSAEPFRVIYAGNLGAANNLSVAIEAAEIVQQQGVSVEWHIYGHGVMQETLQQQINRQAQPHVFLHTPVAKQALGPILQSADALLFTLPDLPVFQYGIAPNKLNDYFLAGRPILFVCNAANNPVSAAQAGLSVPVADPMALADAVHNLMKLPLSERIKMGRNGFDYVHQHYNLDRVAEQLQSVLLAIAQKPDIAS